jgi:hypothetical protein
MTKTNSIITASYAPDFERCKILCESIDKHASGYDCHYLLVAAPDLTLFAQLAGPKRKILTDRQLLPWWLYRPPKFLSPRGRRIWLSPLTVPLHGWHTQQLMRIAVAMHLQADGLLYCDSDTALTKPFDVGSIWDGDIIRFWREDDGALDAEDDHLIWKAQAGRALGIAPNKQLNHNYVCGFVTWNRQTVVDMCSHIEKLHGRSWISVIGSSRKFSECMLYGAYVDAVLGGKGHEIKSVSLCKMLWLDPAPTPDELQKIVSELTDEEFAIGVQSFMDFDAKTFRQVVMPN